MHLHSRALLHFDVIRRCGSIREAARQLHLSSSALNRQLLELESEIGSPLFERLPAGLQLTPVGEILSRHVISVVQDAQRMTSELDALKGMRRGEVDVLTVESVTADFMPRVLQQMAALYPGVRVRVRIAGWADASAQVAQGQADVAICFVRQRMEELRQIAVGQFKLGAIVAPGHPLAGRQRVTLNECMAHPLVLPTPDFALRDELKPVLAAQGAHTRVVLETGSFELMRRLAVQGTGLAFVNRVGIENELRQGTLLHLPLEPQVMFHLGVYVRAVRTLPPAVDALIQLAAAEVERRALEEV
ncbi:MAG: LysR family transcriptional regulator [Rubrivivax sp.]|nr:MAG: LysR family transcriptional regulator [Rubrivivax sp.]